MVELKYDYLELFEEGLAKVELDFKWGYVDKQGNEYWSMTREQAREQMKKR